MYLSIFENLLEGISYSVTDFFGFWENLNYFEKYTADINGL